jgi:hypothetical protein
MTRTAILDRTPQPQSPISSSSIRRASQTRYIPNLATNLTSSYHFKDGKMTFGSLKVDGGPRHMVTNREGTFGWVLTEVSCMIQPVKIDRQTGKLTYNGEPVAITQVNQAVGAGAEISCSRTMNLRPWDAKTTI